jgi:hypothetical protein
MSPAKYQGSKFLIVKMFILVIQEYSHRIGDNKRLGEYLKLPIQRINDFQVLLQVRNKTTIVLDVSYQFAFVSSKGSDNAFARTARGHEGFAKGSRVYAGLAPAAD